MKVLTDTECLTHVTNSGDNFWARYDFLVSFRRQYVHVNTRAKLLIVSHMIHANAQPLECDIKSFQVHKLYLSCFMGILKNVSVVVTMLGHPCNNNLQPIATSLKLITTLFPIPLGYY